MPQRKTRFDRSRLLIGTYCIDTYARDEAHVRDMKRCGIDFLTAAPADHELLDNCRKYGIGVMVTGILPGWWGGDGDNAGGFAEKVPLEKVREAAEEAGLVWLTERDPDRKGPADEDSERILAVCRRREA